MSADRPTQPAHTILGPPDPPVDAAGLLQRLSQEARQRRLLVRFMNTAICLLGVASLVIVWRIHPRWEFPYPNLIYLAIVLVFAIAQKVVSLRSVVRAAFASNDARLAGPLLDLIPGVPRGGLHGSEHLEDVYAALVRLLPLLRASDSAWLTDGQRGQLRRILSRFPRAWRWSARKRVEITVAALQAIAQIGDATAIPDVEKLLAPGLSPKVQAAANDCLPALREAAERERQAQTLLRPASAPADSESVLLRPAAGVAETDSGLLLRPMVGGDE